MDTFLDDGALFAAEKLSAPDEIIGALKTAGGYTKTVPREWTKAEVEWVLEHKRIGYSVEALSQALGRSAVSVQVKLKRLTKIADDYNKENRDEKYQANQRFMQLLSPSSVLDVYSGNSWWKAAGNQTVSNDKDEKFDTDYSLDALDLLCKMKLEGKRFDLIDLDPYGSAYDQIDLALKLAKRGLVISFGEWGHKRWKRFDFVKPRYGIETETDYQGGQRFIDEVQRIAACNKKLAEPVISLQYSNFFRVYFVLSEKKITEQWQKEEK
jgi:hypothetical protein